MTERAGVPDQRDLWDRKHAKNEHATHRESASEFGMSVVERFSPHSRILEIGCGVGGDAEYFADKGHQVLATDFSGVVIEQNNALKRAPGVTFEQLDVSEGLPEIEAKSLDVVYSHLALHYFDDEITAAIFDDIHRVLKPGGVFAFACKSVNDMRYGQGEQIGRDTFVSKGHVRHFFSGEYVRTLLRENYDITQLDEVQREYAGDISEILCCFAVKRG